MNKFRDLSQPTIKIFDNDKIRYELYTMYKYLPHATINIWAMKLVEHVFQIYQFDETIRKIIQKGIEINKKWRDGKARVHDVRQEGFKIHRLAREANTEIESIALRTIGQAISTGHMREHGMVAADYFVKLIGLMTNNDFKAITKERIWQVETLEKLR